MDKDNERETEVTRYRDRYLQRDALSPSANDQQQTQESPRCKFQSKPEGLKTRSTDVQGQAKMDIPGQADTEYTLPLPFCARRIVN